MNCSEANKLSIVGYLSTQGITPEAVENKSAWYISPLRQENTPSFKVNRNLNQWYDFGTGEHGTLIDLVKLLHETSITGALILLQRPDLVTESYSIYTPIINHETNLELKHIQPLQNIALIQYLESRKINPGIASLYTKEAYYNIKNPDTGEIKKYFALAFENDKHGFELRNKYFKGATSPKTITTVIGKNTNVLNIFEGFFDFLSSLIYFNVSRPNCNTIILNSLSYLKTLFEVLTNYQKVNLFFDNDPAGTQASNQIKELHHEVKDYSKILFPNHKDFNEFLNSGKSA